MSPLPPPISARPALPKAPQVARVERQLPLSTELKRIEEENQALRKKLATQREETRVEHKNVEHLRSEVAQLKAKLAAAHPSATVPRSEVDRIRASHLQEVRELRRKHQSEMDDIGANHRRELLQLKREHQTALLENNRKASLHEVQASSGTDQDLKKLHGELAELRRKSSEYQQEIAELRNTNDDLTSRLRAAETSAAEANATAAKAAASPAPSAPVSGDDLTELKGVGQKVARALRAAGITQFKQIASWTDSDIEEIAPKIKTAAGRIRNGDWVGQAKLRASG